MSDTGIGTASGSAQGSAVAVYIICGPQFTEIECLPTITFTSIECLPAVQLPCDTFSIGIAAGISTATATAGTATGSAAGTSTVVGVGTQTGSVGAAEGLSTAAGTASSGCPTENYYWTTPVPNMRTLGNSYCTTAATAYDYARKRIYVPISDGYAALDVSTDPPTILNTETFGTYIGPPAANQPPYCSVIGYDPDNDGLWLLFGCQLQYRYISSIPIAYRIDPSDWSRTNAHSVFSNALKCQQYPDIGGEECGGVGATYGGVPVINPDTPPADAHTGSVGYFTYSSAVVAYKKFDILPWEDTAGYHYTSVQYDNGASNAVYVPIDPSWLGGINYVSTWDNGWIYLVEERISTRVTDTSGVAIDRNTGSGQSKQILVAFSRGRKKVFFVHGYDIAWVDLDVSTGDKVQLARDFQTCSVIQTSLGNKPDLVTWNEDRNGLLLMLSDGPGSRSLLIDPETCSRIEGPCDYDALPDNFASLHWIEGNRYAGAVALYQTNSQSIYTMRLGYE